MQHNFYSGQKPELGNFGISRSSKIVEKTVFSIYMLRTYPERCRMIEKKGEDQFCNLKMCHFREIARENHTYNRIAHRR